MKNPRLDEQAVQAFEPDAKVGLLATLDAEGRPHVSLITSLMAKSPTRLMWGQFCEGLSKTHVHTNPKVGFLVMTLKRQLWRGNALWTGSATEGEDYVLYNKKPMFRYNSYFGIHTVHFMNLVSVSNRQSLPLPGMIAGSLLTSLARLVPWSRNDEPVLNHWSAGHVAKISSLKFLAFVDEDGFPAIVPGVPCQPAGRGKLVFAPTVLRSELTRIQPGVQVAVFALNLETESVLIRGEFKGYLGVSAFSVGSIEIDWVYNSMPPKQGQIYPPVPMEPITSF